MNYLKEAKDILQTVIEKTASSNKVAVTAIELCFLLRNVKEFRCTCRNKDIDIGIAGLKAKLAKGAINKFIVEALLRLGLENKIENRSVNVVMSLTGTNDFVLILKKDFETVKQIQMEDLIKT